MIGGGTSGKGGKGANSAEGPALPGTAPLGATSLSTSWKGNQHSTVVDGPTEKDTLLPAVA